MFGGRRATMVFRADSVILKTRVSTIFQSEAAFSRVPTENSQVQDTFFFLFNFFKHPQSFNGAEKSPRA